MTRDNKIDFFLVGAARCGTTTLYNYLKNHKNVFLPKVKEPNYFSSVESPKKEDYETPKKGVYYHMKIIKNKKTYDSLYSEAREWQLKGDASPSYIWDLNTAQKIYRHNPNAKIIISLRNPVDRAYSHYIMNFFTGVDKSKSFNEALHSKKNEKWGSCNLYLEMGEYYNQVKAYYDIFPKDQIKLLVYEDWTKNLNATLSDLFKFLELDALKINLEINEQTKNKVKALKNMWLLNLLRKNNIKGAIKNVLNQEQVDFLKNLFFGDDKELKKLDSVIKQSLLLNNYKQDLELLTNLTGIEFKKKWLTTYSGKS